MCHIRESVLPDHSKSGEEKNTLQDLFDLTAADLAGFDAVVDAFGAWTPETLDLH